MQSPLKRPDTDAYGTFLTDFAGGLGFVGLAIYEAYPYLSNANIRLLGQSVEVTSPLLLGLGTVAMAVSYPVGAFVTAISSLFLSRLQPLRVFRCPAKWLARFKEGDLDLLLVRTKSLLVQGGQASLEEVDDIEDLLDPLVSVLSPSTYAEMARLRGIGQLARNMAVLALFSGSIEGIKSGLGGTWWSVIAAPATAGAVYGLMVLYVAVQLVYRIWIARQAHSLLLLRRLKVTP